MNAFPATGVIIAFIVAIVLAAALGFLLGRALTRSRYLERLTRAETTSRILRGDGRRDHCGHRPAGGECEEAAGEPTLPRPDADGADHTPEFPDRSPQPTEPPSPGVHRLIGQRPEFNHPPRRLGRGPAQTHRRIRRAPPPRRLRHPG